MGRWPSQTLAAPTPGTPARATTKSRFPGAVVDLGAGHSYPLYDNDVFDDCVTATVGDLIITSLGTTPSTLDITHAFFYAGGTSTEGLSWAQLVDYWSSWPIDGTRLASWSRLKGGHLEQRVEEWLHHGGRIADRPGERAVIDNVRLPGGFMVNGRAVTSGNHMWLVVGYTPTAALVVSWGSELEVSWPDLLAWSAPQDGGGGFHVVAMAGPTREQRPTNG